MGRLVDFADQHPLWAVATAASLARLLAVLLLGPLRPGVVVPDEQQYLDLADFVASGRGAEAWQPEYGQSLYDSTAAFMRPLTRLTEIFGPHQLNGQTIAAVFGVATALLTTALALRVVRVRYAWLAGMTVALLPSQVFWSSVVLRESMVWAALAGLAFALAVATSARSWRGLLACAPVATLCLWVLADLRGQTQFVAGIALVLASLVARNTRRVAVPLGALVLAAAVPWGAGLGPAGYSFVANAGPSLAVTRTNLSIGADSSFIDRTPLPSEREGRAPSRTGAPGASAAPNAPGASGVPDVPGASGARGAGSGVSGAVVTAPSGERFEVDDSAGAILSAFPRGFVAVTARPFPWEPARNAGLFVAKIENAGWIVLYLLAIAGVVAGWRRRSTLAFPVILTGAVVAVAAVTQANLGTAFRHRGQVLWALAVLAAVGAQYLVDRRQSASE